MSDALRILAESQLSLLRREALECEKCNLHTSREHVVFGSGMRYQPKIMFIGEAPGRDEDYQGVPFVGQAGKILDRILVRMEIPRDQVYIDNIAKCRPPQNRVPEKIETSTCTETYLFKQIPIIQPKSIVCLGATATNRLLGYNKPISQLRGDWYSYQGIPVRATYHPAWLLRLGDGTQEFVEAAKLIWSDMEVVLNKLKEDNK